MSADQELLVSSVGALLDKRSRTEDVRAAEPLGFDGDLWVALQDLGPVHMAVDEKHGGWGASMTDLTLVAECLGRRCASAPVIEAQAAARLLARLNAAELGQVLDDGSIATLALHPVTGDTARTTPAGAVADMVLVARADGVAVVTNTSAPPPVANHASLPLADIPIGARSELASGEAALSAYAASVDDWLLLTASALVGLSSSALTLAVDYARERRAFGSPIGAFQGVAHRLADVATGIEGARLLVRDAAYLVDSADPGARERQCMAFAFAAGVAREATYWGVHTFGGYGVMLEYDTQLYFRRARGWAGVFGGPDAAYRRVAEYRYDRRGGRK